MTLTESPGARQSSPRPKILAYYFPNYHVDPDNEKAHGAGWTEWQILDRARPRFAGHQQPRVPALGERDEADPEVMAQEIELARSHGIDGFIFDYYWYDGRPFLHRALEHGFLGAKNSGDLEFSLMWANHDWLDLYPSADPERPAPLLRSAAIDRAQFEEFGEYVIEHYFSQPNYTLIDGRPRFSIYEIGMLIRSLGGIPQTRDALEWLDERVRAAGFPGIHLDVVVWAFAVLPSEVEIEDPASLIAQLGARSASSYVWIHHLEHEGAADFPEDWSAVADRAFSAYEGYVESLAVPFHPNVTTGWDSSPRTAQDVPFRAEIYPWGPIWAPSPEGFRHGLELARAFTEAHPAKYREVTINAWNEWTEGSYLLPDETHGTALLEAVRDVFGVRDPAHPVLSAARERA